MMHDYYGDHHGATGSWQLDRCRDSPTQLADKQQQTGLLVWSDGGLRYRSARLGNLPIAAMPLPPRLLEIQCEIWPAGTDWLSC
jgi:hypothetical protein